MGLPRTFVGFSSTDIHDYELMLAWKANEHIDFNFADCQLNQEINSGNKVYIKRKCRERNEFSLFVRYAENAFSREHTQWIARKDV